jgi:hypothetical protein
MLQWADIDGKQNVHSVWKGHDVHHFEGQKFGMLTVLRRGADAKWMCRCDCGKVTFVITSNLRRGNTKSCGCVRLDAMVKHGMAGTKEYAVWCEMRARCGNAKSTAFRNYGARGITVCPEWSDFVTFLTDMGPRPPGCDLDRRDNDKGYSKDNCRWISRQRNLNNKRTNRFVEYDGKSQTIADWAAELGLHYRTLNNRINRGWPVDRALTTPGPGQET